MDTVNTSPESEAEYWFEQGIEQMAKADYEQATLDFYRVAALSPGFPGSHYNLGICFMMEGKPQEALAAFETVIELSPAHPGATLNAGKCAMALEDMAQAVDWFTLALKKGGDPQQALFGRGLAYYQMGQPQPAIDDFLLVAQDANYGWMAAHYLGCCHMDLSDNQNALVWFANAERQNPGRAETMEMRFLALCRLERYGEALLLFNSLVEGDPSVSIRYCEDVAKARNALNIPVSIIDIAHE